MAYTCSDYRIEMQLLGLKRRLEEKNLTAEERETLLKEIQNLERQMGLR